ncbi:Flp family type IVb pilin [Arenivirga flava]|uniref:Flp family type IVb pilin n=1 Tax=Arenivirga flava TaxID=1930060 RepID=A0AA37UPY4_9MICO|nr:Flp family type IVb pilin [Arenivirga flava]GMA28821.1 hypothetical protein GCM10025874_20740 [Arenivirga flava]
MLALYTRISTEIRTRLSREEEGATAVEYGLIVGLIAVALIAVVGVLTGALSGVFNDISGTLDNVTVGTPATSNG